jgi:transcriptional regulator with XRE-family HTH domain
MCMLQFDGSKLKELRKKRNLKQRELALLVGKGTSHISNYENGVACPPSDTLLNLMSFFQVSAKDLSKNTENATA